MGKNYIDIMSKVSPEAYARLNRIKERYGFASVYEIMQYLVSSFLRVADAENENTEDMAQPVEIARLFQDLEHLETWTNDVKPRAQKSLRMTNAIYLFSGTKKGYNTCRLVSFNGEGHTSTLNKNRALDILVRLCFPHLYGTLRSVREAYGLDSIASSLEYLVDTADKEAIGDSIGREIRQEFESYQTHEPTPSNTIRSKKSINETMARQERREYEARAKRQGVHPDNELPALGGGETGED